MVDVEIAADDESLLQGEMTSPLGLYDSDGIPSLLSSPLLSFAFSCAFNL
jgi:hypothetical protein